MYPLIFPIIALLVPILILLIDLGLGLMDHRPPETLTTPRFVLFSLIAVEIMLGVIYYAYASLPD